MKTKIKKPNKSRIRLGVNIDHAATLRQLRGGTTAYPNLLEVAVAAVRGGAEQITIHLREDRRHIQEKDLRLLSKEKPAPLNLEMAADEKILKLALKYKPDWTCFVPEKREELTTEGGLDVLKNQEKIRKMVKILNKKQIQCSMFIEASFEQVQAAYEVGAQAVEFHTGHWVLLKGKAQQKEWLRLVAAAKKAYDLGLRVHAGHGLDYETASRIKKLPHLIEVNIGHSLVCYALDKGLQVAVNKMKIILNKV